MVYPKNGYYSTTGRTALLIHATIGELAICREAIHKRADSVSIYIKLQQRRVQSIVKANQQLSGVGQVEDMVGKRSKETLWGVR